MKFKTYSWNGILAVIIPVCLPKGRREIDIFEVIFETKSGVCFTGLSISLKVQGITGIELCIKFSI